MDHSLNKLIINNVKLEKLESKLNKFNPLSILKVNEYEIRHSNILSWLLDPNENHGLGEEFIKKFLGEVILLNEDIDLEISVLDIYLNNFYDMQVLREWNNIDILAISHSNKIVILIENKIKAKERKGQLKRYSDIVETKFKNYKKLKVFLTVEGEEPTENEYVICNYYSILKILTHIMELNSGSLNSKVEDFINYYIDVLEDIVDEDEETLALCREIYKENKKIIDYIANNKNKVNLSKGSMQEKAINVYNIYEKSIDMILRHGKTSPFLEAANKFIIDNNDVILYNINNTYCVFINKNMERIRALSNEEIPIYYGFNNGLKNNRLRMFIQVQSFGENYLKRIELLQRLNGMDEFDIKQKSFNPESRYTRIYSKSIVVNEITESKILGLMNKLYKDSLKVLEKILEAAMETLE